VVLVMEVELLRWLSWEKFNYPFLFKIKLSSIFCWFSILCCWSFP